MTTQKKDDEKRMTLAACGIFSVALLVVMFTAGNLFHMGVLLSIMAVISIGGCVYSWVLVLKNINDPNKDYWRWLCILFAIAGIVIIMGARAGWLEKKQVLIDSQKEQSIK